jgi:hypothetical protein
MPGVDILKPFEEIWLSHSIKAFNWIVTVKIFGKANIMYGNSKVHWERMYGKPPYSPP